MILCKDKIISLKDPFQYICHNEVYESLNENKFTSTNIKSNKLIKIPIKIYGNDLLEMMIYSSGKSSFITLLSTNKEPLLIIKFDFNNLKYLSNKLISNSDNILTVCYETNTNVNYIVFFKNSIEKNYLTCYQEREKTKNSDYNIDKVNEILLEINHGMNEINDNLIEYNEKNISIYKIFKSII